jgi:hypothetical protein
MAALVSSAADSIAPATARWQNRFAFLHQVRQSRAVFPDTSDRFSTTKFRVSGASSFLLVHERLQAVDVTADLPRAY